MPYIVYYLRIIALSIYQKCLEWKSSIGSYNIVSYKIVMKSSIWTKVQTKFCDLKPYATSNLWFDWTLNTFCKILLVHLITHYYIWNPSCSLLYTYCLPCHTIGLVFPNISKGMTLYTQAAITKIEAKGIPSEHNGVMPYPLHFVEHPINIIMQGITLSNVKYG